MKVLNNALSYTFAAVLIIMCIVMMLAATKWALTYLLGW